VTSGAAAATGCHGSTVGGPAESAGSGCTDCRATRGAGAAASDSWNDDAAASDAPTHRIRARPITLRKDARRADRRRQLAITRSNSLTAYIVRDPSQSGAADAESMP